MSDQPAEMPAYGPGAERLLRELIERGLSPDAVQPAAALILRLDSGAASAIGTSAPSASTSTSATEPDAAAELLSMLDAASEEQ